MNKSAAVELLFLSEPELIEAGVLDMEHCVETIDKMFQVLGEGDYLMGGPKENDHGLMLWFPEEKRFDNMPIAGPDRRFMSLISYLGGEFNIAGDKWYGSNIANKDKGLPRSILTVTLNNVDTGQPLAYMSGNLISAMRTGAVPGVASRHLAREDSKVLGVVGTGVINRACVAAIKYAVPTLEVIKVFDINFDRSKAFIKELESELNVKFKIEDSLEACIRDSDIISVATSGAAKPVIEDEWIKKGCLITLTGTAQLSDEFYKNNKIVADNWKMHEAWYRDGREHPNGIDSILSWAPTGDLIHLAHKKEIDQTTIQSLGDIAYSKEKVRKSDDETIIFVTGGLPTEDIAWGYEVYKKAKEKAIGQKLKLWDTPHWA
ncbi:ornithine cyclodeaminase [Oceanobacillus bengalensis]|uniref:Ornithine cyclodeaminase n=1 Tax=Oceanobacillus bengalensis TaxID=1435466 RepID=A0A494YSR8_9BACI|nr:ornithine cyclodeaminase [Oceanobacillus bengalensis]